MGKIPGYRQINGTFGKVWWDGELIFEVDSFEAKITVEREDIQMAGDNEMESKMKSLKGEGNMTVKKVFSRGMKKLLDAWKSGQDVRSQLVSSLKDPDTSGKQSERVTIDNVWFNELTLAQFEVGQVLTREFPFGFTPSSVKIVDVINVVEG